MSESDVFQEHIRWIEHRGRKLLTIHFRGLSDEQMIATIERMGEVMSASPGMLRVLIDLREASLSSAFMSRVKQLGKEVFQLKTERRAFLGITGVKMILVQAYNRFTGADKDFKLFEEEGAALNWLAS